MPKTQNEKILLGEAAEHLVLSRLLIRNHVASQGPRGWAADDIIVSDGRKIQVKANTTGTKGGWFVDQSAARNDRFYALVDFGDPDAPCVYVLPSHAVQAAINADHDAVMTRKPNSKDSGIRKIYDPWGRNGPPAGYEDGWLEQYTEAWWLLLAAGAHVRARVWGWRESRADPTNPALPTLDGVPEWLEGQLDISDVSVPQNGIAYTRYAVGGIDVEPVSIVIAP